MSGEANCCTVEALLVRIIALEKLVDRVERDISDASAQAQREADRVLEVALRDKAQANEWRGTVNEIMTTMVSRSEYATAHAVLVDKLESVDHRFNAQEGAMMGSTRATQQLHTQRNQTIIWAFLTLTMMVSIIGIVLDLVIPH